MEYENTLGENLKILRKEKNVTQQVISELIQVDRSNIANYENGRSLPSLSSLIKIAEFFEVSLDQLIFNNKQNSNNADKELMAENTILMEEQVKLYKKIESLEKEVELLKSYNKVLKNYTEFLESDKEI